MSLAETLAPIWAELSSIKKRLPSVSPATVTSVGPVRIQVDGQSAPVAASPDSLVPVGPGDRVRVLRYGTTHLILGRVNTVGQPWRVAAGTVTIPASTSVTSTATVTFPPGRFTQRPIVTATALSSHYSTSVGVPTTESVTVGARRLTGSDVGEHDVMWHAVQMTPTSAEG